MFVLVIIYLLELKQKKKKKIVGWEKYIDIWFDWGLGSLLTKRGREEVRNLSDPCLRIFLFRTKHPFLQTKMDYLK